MVINFWHIVLTEEVNKAKIKNNVIKLQSLVHYEFPSVKFISKFRCEFAKEGYIDKDENFVTPKDYCFKFQESMQTCFVYVVESAEEETLVRCAHCEKYFWFTHFFGKKNVSKIDDHQCMVVQIS